MCGRHSPFQVEALEARRLLANLTAQLAEQLAREVSYRDWNSGATVTIATGNNANPTINLPYTVSRQWHDHDSGFDAYGLTSAENGPVVVFRGSEFFPDQFKYRDLASDANPKGIGYDQFARNWKSVRDWMKAQNASIDFVGHSLGGALAQWFASAWSNVTDAGPGAGDFPVDLVYTFCSPGISDSRAVNPFLLTYASGAGSLLTAPGFNPARAHGVEHHLTIGDIVVMGGEKFIQGNVITYSWAESNIIFKHTRPFLNADVRPTARDVLTRAAGPITVAPMPIATLNAPGYVHADADYLAIVTTAQLVTNALAMVVPAARPLRLIPVILMRRDLCEASRATLGALLNAITDQFDLTKVGNVWTIRLGGQSKGLFRASAFEFDPSVTLSIDDTAGVKSLVITGKMRVTVPIVPFNIPLPDELGGPINVNNLISLAELDANGRIDKNGMTVRGELSILGGIATLNGTITYDWFKDQIAIDGNMNLLRGLAISNSTLYLNSDLSVTGNGTADLYMPAKFPVVGGNQIAGGTFDFKFDPANLPGSYFEGIGEQPLLFGRTLRAGARATMDGGLTVILGGKRIPVIPRPGEGQAVPEATFDIPSGQDWLIIDAAGDSLVPAIELVRPDGVVIDEAQMASDPGIELFTAFNDSLSRAAIVMSPMPGLWSIRVLGISSEVPVAFSAFVDKALPSATFQSATGGARRESVHVVLDVVDPNQDVTVSLYFDQESTGGGDLLIAQGLTPTAGVIDFTWDVTHAPLGSGFVRAVLSSPDIANTTVTSNSIRITEVRPAYVGGLFEYEDTHLISITFDQNVGLSLDANDVLLTNLSTGTTYGGSQLSLAYRADLSTLTIAIPSASSSGGPGTLPDGNYRLTAAGSGIANADGETMRNDVRFDFFVLAGDFNRDRAVNYDDLLTLAAAYRDDFVSYSLGDANYDHRVTFDDLLIVTQQYGQSLFSVAAIEPRTRSQRHSLVEL